MPCEGSYFNNQFHFKPLIHYPKYFNAKICAGIVQRPTVLS